MGRVRARTFSSSPLPCDLRTLEATSEPRTEKWVRPDLNRSLVVPNHQG